MTVLGEKLRFNPPPNWPAPPAGWTPPQGWRPDPGWGPPPADWQLWVPEPDRPSGRWSRNKMLGTAAAAVVGVVLVSSVGVAMADSSEPEAASAVVAAGSPTPTADQTSTAPSEAPTTDAPATEAPTTEAPATEAAPAPTDEPTTAPTPAPTTPKPKPTPVDKWKVVSSADLESNFWDCTINYCPAYHEPWYGGTLVVRNVGTRPQRVKFKVEMYYKPTGHVSCSFEVDQTVFDRRLAEGDGGEALPGEEDKDDEPAPPVGRGKTVKVFLDDDSDSTGSCLRADDVKFTARIVPSDAD
jgi:hypothetical protein